MKKIIPVLAVLGSAVAFAVYKMKKDEQKQLIDLDEGLLKDDEDICPCEEPIIHEPLQQAAQETPTEVEEEPVKEETPQAESTAPCDEACHCEAAEEAFSAEYPHLTKCLVDDINAMTKDAIASLAKDGDVHEHERPIQHMVTFTNQSDLDTFKSIVINKGFVITKGEGDFELIVLHISPIDEQKLVQNILYLADQAYANHGEYRGWQSKVSF